MSRRREHRDVLTLFSPATSSGILSSCWELVCMSGGYYPYRFKAHPYFFIRNSFRIVLSTSMSFLDDPAHTHSGQKVSWLTTRGLWMINEWRWNSNLDTRRNKSYIEYVWQSTCWFPRWESRCSEKTYWVRLWTVTGGRAATVRVFQD